MSDPVDQLAGYADADLALVLRKALVKAALNQSYSVDGVTFTRQNLKSIAETLEVVEARIQATKPNRKPRRIRTQRIRFNQP